MLCCIVYDRHLFQLQKLKNVLQPLAPVDKTNQIGLAKSSLAPGAPQSCLQQQAQPGVTQSNNAPCTQPLATATTDGAASSTAVLSVHEFDWDSYLKLTRSKPTPLNAFTHVS